MILRKAKARFSEDGKTLVECPKDYKGEFTIPEGVETISTAAFKGCEGITGVSIPHTVKTIAHEAFMDCKNVEFINFKEPSRVSYIGTNAFYMCEKIEKISIPEQVTSISPATFYNCAYLKRVTLPKDIKEIGAAAFWGCSNLPEIMLPESLERIGDSAFGACFSLKEIIIPDKVEEIESETFTSCTNLLKVLLGVNSRLSRIHSRAFYNCSRLANINLPDSIKRIDNHAFHNCDSLKSLYIPKNTETLATEIAAMSNMSFAFYCEGEPGSDWATGWNYMSKHVAGPNTNPPAPTMFNVPRWWYEKFALPMSISDGLLRVSSTDPDFNKEEAKALINSTDKTLFFRNGWGWRGEGREEITKEAAIGWIEIAAPNPPDKSCSLEIYEYETEILLNLFDHSLPF